MDIFISNPWLALVVAAGLGLLVHWSGSKTAAVAALAWAGYGVYEYMMHARVLCTGECNIRVDLLALYPLLAVLVIASIVQGVRARHRSRLPR